MSNKSKNTQFQNATASTLKAISGDLVSEREIKFSGSSSYLSSKEIRLPQILKELDKTQLSKLRGESDKIALKIKYHDPVVHNKYLPSSDLSSKIFQFDRACNAVDGHRLEAQTPLTVIVCACTHI